jgi:hypothetical protein
MKIEEKYYDIINWQAHFDRNIVSIDEFLEYLPYLSEKNVLESLHLYRIQITEDEFIDAFSCVPVKKDLDHLLLQQEWFTHMSDETKLFFKLHEHEIPSFDAKIDKETFEGSGSFIRYVNLDLGTELKKELSTNLFISNIKFQSNITKGNRYNGITSYYLSDSIIIKLYVNEVLIEDVLYEFSLKHINSQKGVDEMMTMTEDKYEDYIRHRLRQEFKNIKDFLKILSKDALIEGIITDLHPKKLKEFLCLDKIFNESKPKTESEEQK